MASDHAELRERLRIDRQDLQLENVQHSSLFYQVALARYLAEHDVEVVEREKASTFAELNDEFREEADRNDKKMTKDAADAKVRSDARYLEVCQHLLSAKREVAYWKALHEAWQERGRTLRNLKELELSQGSPGYGHQRDPVSPTRRKMFDNG